MKIEQIISAFNELRERGVRDPLVCRLKVPQIDAVCWVFRDKSQQGKNLHTGESFKISFQEAGEIQIQWKPIFETHSIGDSHTKHYAWWFFNQEPKVCGGTHESLDDFTGKTANWNMSAKDFYLVRCGTYTTNRGERITRKPSDQAQSWIRDENLFRVPDEVRKNVISYMNGPDRRGEWYTIRRVFEET